MDIDLAIRFITQSGTLLTAAIGLLTDLPQADGHWHSDDGAAFHVHVTLEALRALQLCGAF